MVFREVWDGFRAGSIPIGAAIYDSQGNLIAHGRNHIYDDLAAEGQVRQHQLAHAELNTLLQVDRRSLNLHNCILYTSMEPCPLCMGAIYMSGIRTVAFAARDGYAGSSNLLGTTPYLSRKNIKITQFAEPGLEIILLGIQLVVERRRLHLTGLDLYETVIGAWAEICPAGVAFGEILAQEESLPVWVVQCKSCEWVFDTLMEKAKTLFPVM